MYGCFLHTVKTGMEQDSILSMLESNVKKVVVTELGLPHLHLQMYQIASKPNPNPQLFNIYINIPAATAVNLQLIIRS